MILLPVLRASFKPDAVGRARECVAEMDYGDGPNKIWPFTDNKWIAGNRLNS